MVTVILIAATCLVSILCFTGTLNGNRLLLNAYSVWHRREWHRMLSHGFVHGGWGHLIPRTSVWEISLNCSGKKKGHP